MTPTSRPAIPPATGGRGRFRGGFRGGDGTGRTRRGSGARRQPGGARRPRRAAAMPESVERPPAFRRSPEPELSPFLVRGGFRGGFRRRVGAGRTRRGVTTARQGRLAPPFPDSPDRCEKRKTEGNPLAETRRKRRSTRLRSRPHFSLPATGHRPPTTVLAGLERSTRSRSRPHFGHRRLDGDPPLTTEMSSKGRAFPRFCLNSLIFSPLPESEPPLLVPEPPLLVPESPLLEPEPPLLEPKSPLLEPKSPLLESEPPLLEPESPWLPPSWRLLDGQTGLLGRPNRVESRT